MLTMHAPSRTRKPATAWEVVEPANLAMAHMFPRLTTIDAGTRAGHFLLQDFKSGDRSGNIRSLGANLFTSVLLVSVSGWFVYQRVLDR